ncbi:hypothetical protein D9M71_803940 [compost metagenome]
MAEMSSTSSTSASRLRDEAWMVFTHSRCSSSSRVVASTSVMPDRPLSGVRISWLMLARNRLLASLARRASSIAWVSWRSRVEKYSGTAASPSHRPNARRAFCCQYGVITAVLPKLTSAIATAT